MGCHKDILFTSFSVRQDFIKGNLSREVTDLIQLYSDYSAAHWEWRLWGAIRLRWSPRAVLRNNRNLFPHSSRSHKSKIKVSAGPHFSLKALVELLPHPFLASGGCQSSWWFLACRCITPRSTSIIIWCFTFVSVSLHGLRHQLWDWGSFLFQSALILINSIWKPSF